MSLTPHPREPVILISEPSPSACLVTQTSGPMPNQLPLSSQAKRTPDRRTRNSRLNRLRAPCLRSQRSAFNTCVPATSTGVLARDCSCPGRIAFAPLCPAPSGSPREQSPDERRCAPTHHRLKGCTVPALVARNGRAVDSATPTEVLAERFLATRIHGLSTVCQLVENTVDSASRYIPAFTGILDTSVDRAVAISGRNRLSTATLSTAPHGFPGGLGDAPACAASG